MVGIWLKYDMHELGGKSGGVSSVGHRQRSVGGGGGGYYVVFRVFRGDGTRGVVLPPRNSVFHVEAPFW